MRLERLVFGGPSFTSARLGLYFQAWVTLADLALALTWPRSKAVASEKRIPVVTSHVARFR